ncbi:uncharacterized protein LOC123309360 [Coccinella septempunctata]|uniref:uncharacterized protein LOC123309360 n=1 Tax=Coccinella septempunctata TaxID=41139 RepID=UPI001D079E69|nr:uncharacterized protein LOC123309360 [Coccinella septempunctata]
MNNSGSLFISTFLLVLTQEVLSQFDCYSCQGGYTTSCGSVNALGATEKCEGPDAQCYESIKYFQRGVIRYVERRCWVPDKKSKTKDYCSSFNNPNGQLIYCKTCKTSNCNTHPYGTCGLKDPNPNSNFTDFHYVGFATE